MLDAHNEREALAIFESVLDAAPAALDALITERCGGRDALVQRVHELLAADEAATASSTLLGAESGTRLAGPRSAAELPLPPPPPQVGPWALEELIGSGGMGAVYRARRADGLFEQAVAVKFVRVGAASHSPLLQLMDAERRLLARMSHPSIARILDAGSTADGVPYLVMELVDGLPLHRFAEAQQLGWRERVLLVRQVCAAVAHAHGLLVLHNDIKPANVLVSADGLPKLIDFGVARLQGVADDALPQGFTPGYASPQWRAGEAPAIADDVYALGVMLRELLAAFAPDAELDAIIGRATAAQRDDRYATVAALADDLQRRLDQRPVLALHGGGAYRARKLLQRRPWRVAAGAAAALGLLAALVVTSALYLRAEDARREAQTRFNQTRDMARFMIFELDDQLEAVTGTTPARRAVVARGQQYIDALAATASDDRSLQREVAVALRRLAEVQGVPGRANLGERAAALANVKRAEAMLVALQPGADWTWQRDLGHVRYVHSLFTGDSGADYPSQLALAQQAEQLLVPAFAGAEAAGASAQQLGELHTTLLGARLSQGFALRFLDRHADAGRIQAAEEQRIDALPAPIRAAIDYDYHRGRAPTSLGDSLYYQGQIDAALAAYQRGAQAFEAGLAQRPNNRKLLEGLQIALWNIAGTLGELKRHPEELEVISRALPISERLLGLDPKNRQAAHMMMVISDHLANALSNNGRHAEALRIAEANRRQRDLNTEDSPDDGAVVRSSIVNLWPLSSMYRAAGDRAGECKAIAEALRRWERYERRWGLAPADLKSDVGPLRARRQEAGCKD